MDKVREWHAGARDFAVEALGHDEQAVAIVEWSSLAVLVFLGGWLFTRSCRQTIGMASDLGEIMSALLALLTTVASVIERTWVRLFVAVLSAVFAYALLRLAVDTYANMDDHEAAATALADKAQAAVASARQQSPSWLSVLVWKT